MTTRYNSFKELLEAQNKESEYDNFFKKVLKKFNVKDPDQLSDEKKKEFFDYIDKNWNSEDEAGDDGEVD